MDQRDLETIGIFGKEMSKIYREYYLQRDPWEEYHADLYKYFNTKGDYVGPRRKPTRAGAMLIKKRRRAQRQARKITRQHG